ncbi:MAG: hypothetical protein ABI638_13390 [Ignavibacteriota bacterium]
MIDEQKVIGLLQAKALGCLDADENEGFQEFIDAGHLFPWDELGKFQHVASLLPLALQLELPDPALKDRVALKLIKLSEQLRASKIIDEDKFEIEEDVDESVNEFTNIDEPIVEPPIEIETEEPTVVEDNLVSELNPDEITFNLDEVTLPGFEPTEVSENNIKEPEQIESPFDNLVDESQIEYPQVEEVEISEVLAQPKILLPLVSELGVDEEVAESKPEATEVPENNIKEPEPIESPFDNLVDESQIEYPQVEEVEINEVSDQPEIPLPLVPETIVNEETLKNKPESEATEVIEEEHKPVVEETKDNEDESKLVDFNKRSVAEKMFKAIEQDFDTLKFHFEETERKTTRGLLISYIVIAVLLALLIFSFFKFSSDINGLKNEVRDLKNKVSSSLYDEQEISTNQYFSS